MRSTMTQDKLTDLGVLSIENEITRTADCEDIIHDIENIKARKVLF